MKTLRVPLQIDSRGGLAFTESTADIVAQQIVDILATDPYDRIMNPNYGAAVRNFIFSPVRQQTMRIKADEIMSLLSRSVSLATIISVTMTPSPVSESTLTIEVRYTISPSPEVRTLTTTISGLISEETAFGDVL